MMRAILGGYSEEEYWFVDIDALNPVGAAGWGIVCLGAPGKPFVITRSGIAVKTGRLKKYMSSFSGRLPGLRRLLHFIL